MLKDAQNTESQEPADPQAPEEPGGHAPAPTLYAFTLYITGSTGRSRRAVANISGLCKEYFPGRFELEVVDLYQHPEAAQEGNILAAPTLVKRLPLPLRRFIGDLSQPERLLARLELRPYEAKPEESSRHGTPRSE